jgi:hypothetical protein
MTNEPIKFPGAAAPNNLEAEQALLAAILVRNDSIYQVGNLKAAHFFEPVHARIFEAAGKLIARGKTYEYWIEPVPGFCGNPSGLGRIFTVRSDIDTGAA